MDSTSKFLAVADGDRRIARQLDTSLQTLLTNSPDAGFRSMLDEVLTGRRTLRELASTPEFARASASAVESATELLQHLSPEALLRRAEEGSAYLDSLAAEAVKPQRPEIDSADDDYFRDKRQQGWLQD